MNCFVKGGSFFLFYKFFSDGLFDLIWPSPRAGWLFLSGFALPLMFLD